MPGRTPFWMKAKFPGNCHRCRAKFKPGDSIFFWPSNRIAFCSKRECGGAESAVVKQQVARAAGAGQPKLFGEEG